MSNQLANPLQSIIARAAQTAAVTGETAQFQRRFAHAGGASLILADVSSSMSERAGARSKIEHLRDALRQAAKPGHVILAFASEVTRIGTPDALPAPSGGTALELALRAAAGHRPSTTLVISDGEPNSPEAALEAAAALSGIINVIYCGPESNASAIDFMRRLARAGCGRVVVHSWAVAPGRPELADNIRLLLPG